MKLHKVILYVKTPTFGDFVYINPLYIPNIGEEVCLDGSSTLWKVTNIRTHLANDQDLAVTMTVERVPDQTSP